MGAYRVARLAGFAKIIGFDMGGTSTDVAPDRRGRAEDDGGVPALGELPVGVPMLDIHTVGAGGGSLARFDAGGVLRVWAGVGRVGCPGLSVMGAASSPR